MAHHYRVSDAIACPSGKSWPAAFRPTLCLLGYTHENLHLVEVNKAEWLSSTLSHELVHVVELKARGRAGHCRWDPRGVKAALFRVTGSQDDSDSDCTDEAESK